MSKLSKYLIGAVATAVVLFLVWYFGNIVAYILVSAVLAIIGKPMVDFLSGLRVYRWRLPKWFAALVTLAVIWAVAVIFMRLFIPLIFGKLHELSHLDISQLVESYREPLARLQNDLQFLFSAQAGDFSIADALARQIGELVNLNVINDIFGRIANVIGDTVVALFSVSFITFFFLKEDKLFANMVIAVFPNRYESNVRHALDSVTVLLVRYFSGILAESTVLLVIIAGVLMIFGFSASNALFIGLVMGVMNVVPYIGPLIGGAIAVFIGIISPLPGASAVDMTLIIASTLIVIKGIDDFVLQPALYSNRVKAHPLEIFIVILVAGSVAGVLGMLLAIPSYTVLRVFAKEFFNHFRLVRQLTEKI